MRGARGVLGLAALLSAAFLFPTCFGEPDSSLGPERPRFIASSQSIACGHWSAYVEDTSGFLVLGLEAEDSARLPEQYTRNVAEADGLPPKVEARLYRTGSKNSLRRLFCNDVLEPGDTILYSLIPDSGLVAVRKYDFAPDTLPIYSRTFRLDLELRGLSFEEKDGRFLIDTLRLDSLLAGWLPG